MIKRIVIRHMETLPWFLSQCSCIGSALIFTPHVIFYPVSQTKTSAVGAGECLWSRSLRNTYLNGADFLPQGVEVLIVSISNDLIGKPCVSQKPPPQLALIEGEAGAWVQVIVEIKLPYLLSEWSVGPILEADEGKAWKKTLLKPYLTSGSRKHPIPQL